MSVRSTEVFHSLVNAAASAELAMNRGEFEKCDEWLQRAREIIAKEGLERTVAIVEIPYHTTNVYRLRGSDGSGISYRISEDGVTFE